VRRKPEAVQVERNVEGLWVAGGQGSCGQKLLLLMLRVGCRQVTEGLVGSFATDGQRAVGLDLAAVPDEDGDGHASRVEDGGRRRGGVAEQVEALLRNGLLGLVAVVLEPDFDLLGGQIQNAGEVFPFWG